MDPVTHFHGKKGLEWSLHRAVRMPSDPTGEDLTFDALFPSPVRGRSRRFWTPVAVARRAATLFRDSGPRFVRDTLKVEHALRGARVGSLVVTFHGSSTRVPGCYDLALAERAGSDWLRLWVKRRETDDGSFFLEGDDWVVWQPPFGSIA